MPLTDIAAAPQRPEPGSWPDDRLTVAWLGHATVLLNFQGSWVLTDPALERRIGIGRGLAKLGLAAAGGESWRVVLTEVGATWSMPPRR